MNTTQELDRLQEEFEEKIMVYPSAFPEDRKLRIMPGDLSKFAPYGNSFYGYQNRNGSNPFLSAPTQEAEGGTIYFDNDIPRPDFEALCRILRVKQGNEKHPATDYAAFIGNASSPVREGFIQQMRLISRSALKFLYNAIDDTDSVPRQELSYVDAMWLFMQKERERWGTSFGQDHKGLRGMFGGDGNFSREQLAFGLAMENEFYGICRIWSRAWLVTK